MLCIDYNSELLIIEFVVDSNKKKCIISFDNIKVMFYVLLLIHWVLPRNEKIYHLLITYCVTHIVT